MALGGLPFRPSPWIPAYAGMTDGEAGMTDGEAGMTDGEAGMTEGVGRE